MILLNSKLRSVGSNVRLSDLMLLQYFQLDKVQLILNKQKEKVADVENTASSMRSRLQEWRARAEAEGPEIQTDRHYEDITKEIAQLQKKQRDQEARFDCTLEEVPNCTSNTGPAG